MSSTLTENSTLTETAPLAGSRERSSPAAGLRSVGIVAAFLLLPLLSAKGQEPAPTPGDQADPAAAQTAAAPVPPALSTALEDFEGGRYLLVRDRTRALLADDANLTVDDRTAVLWLAAAVAARTGQQDEFQDALAELRNSAPNSPFRYLAEIERLTGSAGDPPTADGNEAVAFTESQVSGLPEVATLLVAENERGGSPSTRAALYGEAASLGGPLGAVAAYQAGRLWRQAERPDSAAAAFARARSAAPPLGRLALVGQAEATLMGGDPQGALDLLDHDFSGSPHARTLADLRNTRTEIRSLLQTQDEIVGLEIELLQTDAGERDEKALAIARQSAELRPQLDRSDAGPESDGALPGPTLAEDLDDVTTMAIQKVRARALVRLGRTEDARLALEEARDQASTVAGRAEVEILLADLTLVTGDPAGARTLFADASRALEEAGSTPTANAPEAGRSADRAVVDMGTLVHRWSDRVTRSLITRNDARGLTGAAATGDAGARYASSDLSSPVLSSVWSMPGAPDSAESQVRAALWLLLDARLEALRSDLLGSARGMAAARALERLGAEADSDILEDARDRAGQLLTLLLGPHAAALNQSFEERAAALETALFRSREIRSALRDGSLPVAEFDAPLVTNRPGEATGELMRFRARSRDLLRMSHDLVELELALGHVDEPLERGRVAVKAAERIRELRVRLDSTESGEAVPSPDRDISIDQNDEDWSRAAVDLVGRGQAALVAAPDRETARAIRTIHETERRVRSGEIERDRAVEILQEELEEATMEVRRGGNRSERREAAARSELQRALESRSRAVEESPTSPHRVRQERMAAALEAARFGEASAGFFAALDASDEDTATALGEAIRLQHAFVDDHPETPLHSTALFQLAELEIRRAESRFGIEQGRQRRVAGDRRAMPDHDRAMPDYDRASPDYEPAIESLERTLRRAEGEERTVALQTLGHLLFQEGRYEEAARRMDEYTATLESEDPRLAEGLFRQADAIFAAGMERSGEERQDRLAEASDLYRLAADRSTGGSETEILALYKLGWSRYLRDEYEGATEAFGTLLDRYAGFSEETERPLDLSDEVMEYTAVSLSQHPAPVERAARFADGRPDEFEYPMYRSLARTLAEQGRLPDAVATLEAYRERRPLHPAALESHKAQLRLLEFELADSAQAQDARLELVQRFGPRSEWWEANPGVRDSATAVVGEALREAAHYRMRQAQERSDPSLYGEAGELYLRYVETLPPNDSTRTLRYMAGEAFFEAGAHLRAGDAYRHAAYEDRGELGLEKEAGWNAIAAYHEAVAGDRASASSDEAAKKLYAAVDRFVEAFPDAEEAPRTLRTRAEVASRMGDAEAARESYRTLIERFPESDYVPRARKLLGDLAYQAGEHDEAFELWEAAEATARDAGDGELAGEVAGLRAEASLSLADSLADAGDLEDAAKRYLEFARSHPGDERARDAYGNAANVLIEADRKDGAVEVLTELLEAYPRHEEAFDNAVLRAELLAEQERHRDAIDAYRRAYDQFPGAERRADVLLRVAELQEEIGDRVGAAESWSRFHRSHPDDPRSPDALFSAAETLEETGQTERADELYGEFVDRHPGHVQAVAAAAHLLELRHREATGPVDEARRRLLEIVADAPPDAVEPHRRLVGMAHVETAEDRFRGYRDIRFAPSELSVDALRAERARKDQALDEIVQHLEAAVETGAAEPVSQGLYLLGEAYAAYAEYLRDVELPEGTGAEVQRTVEERTSELAREYDDRARQPWTRLVELGSEMPDEMDLDDSTPGTQNPWIARAEESLEQHGRTP